MKEGVSFDTLLATPGPSTPAQPPPAAGGFLPNSAVMAAVMTAPEHQARIRVEQSREALKRRAFQNAQVMSGFQP